MPITSQQPGGSRPVKRWGWLLASSVTPNWSQHNFEHFGQQLGPSHPLIEGHWNFFTAMGAEICSSVLGTTRPLALYFFTKANREMVTLSRVGLIKPRTGGKCLQWLQTPQDLPGDLSGWLEHQHFQRASLFCLSTLLLKLFHVF